MSKLPDGWAKVALPHVAAVLDTRRIPLNADERNQRIAGKSADSLVPYYGATGQVGWIDEALFDENLVLLGEDGAPFLDLQKPKAYRISGKSWVNNHAHVLRAREGVLDWRLLERQLNSIDYTGFVTGTTRPKLTQGAMNTLPILVPPFQEQTRIADKLDKLLARVQSCNERIDAIPALLKRFRQAVLGAAISDELSPDLSVNHGIESSDGGLPSVMLGELLAEPLRNGKSVRDGSGLPVLRLTSLKAGGIDLSEAKRGDWSDVADINRFLIKNGDYLVSRGNGSMNLVGRGALVSDCEEDIAFPDTMIRIRLDAERVHPIYLKYVWSSQLVRRQIERLAKTTAGIWKVSQPDLESVRLPLPTLDHQQEIVRRVEALFKLADRIEARYTAVRAQAQRLTPLLLAKAFRGELVQQDPKDEPASVLLERIAATKPAKARTSRGQPRIQKRPPTIPELNPIDWASLPNGAWAAPADPDGQAAMVWLTAVLRAWGEPVPEREARLAAMLCQQPRLFTSVLPAAQATQWSRLVGDEARPLPTQVLPFQPAINGHWARAIKGMRARDDLVEAGLGDGITWALGSSAASIETAGWPDGRAGFVVAYLRAHGIASVLPLLEPSAQEFVDARAA